MWLEAEFFTFHRTGIGARVQKGEIQKEFKILVFTAQPDRQVCPSCLLTGHWLGLVFKNRLTTKNDRKVSTHMNRKKHTALDEASERLTSAFSRLERAVSHASHYQASGTAGEDDGAWAERFRMLEDTVASLKDDNQRLQDENVRLSNQLQTLQKDYLHLQQVADKVADRMEKQAVQLDLIASA